MEINHHMDRSSPKTCLDRLGETEDGRGVYTAMSLATRRGANKYESAARAWTAARRLENKASRDL